LDAAQGVVVLPEDGQVLHEVGVQVVDLGDPGEQVRDGSDDQDASLRTVWPSSVCSASKPHGQQRSDGRGFVAKDQDASLTAMLRRSTSG